MSNNPDKHDRLVSRVTSGNMQIKKPVTKAPKRPKQIRSTKRSDQ